MNLIADFEERQIQRFIYGKMLTEDSKEFYK
jgi:hypothetical protein